MLELGIVSLMLSICSLFFLETGIVAFSLLFSFFIITIIIAIIIYFESRCVIVFLNDSIKIFKKEENLHFRYYQFHYAYFGVLGILFFHPFTMDICLKSISKEMSFSFFINKKDYLIIKSLFEKNKY